MRWQSRCALRSREGETRIRRKFLWIPRCFGRPEWRWLEFAHIRERVERYPIYYLGPLPSYGWRWEEIGFTDRPADDAGLEGRIV